MSGNDGIDGTIGDRVEMNGEIGQEFKFLVVAEAAKLLHRSEEGVRLLLRQGKIRGSNPTGRKWLVPRPEVNRFLEGSGGVSNHARAQGEQPNSDTGLAAAAASQWISQNLREIVHVIEQLKNGLPRPAAAEGPDKVLYTPGRHIVVGRDPGLLYWETLKRKLVSYTRDDPVWKDIQNYQPEAKEIRSQLDTLYGQVHRRIAEVLDTLDQETGGTNATYPEKPFIKALFYYATGVALGHEAWLIQEPRWAEQPLDQGYVELIRYGRFKVATIQEGDKELVKEVFDKLEGIVGNLTNVAALKEKFASLNQRMARINEALDALLLR